MHLEAALEPRRRAAAPTTTSAAEMQAAREVQARLMKQRAPRLDTLDYSACCIPARTVGGDYYDFFRPAPGRCGLALGDVSGSGIGAALMMASLQASLRSRYATDFDDLPRLLASVNGQHFDCTAPQHFASLFLGDYDDRSRKLRYANCGHPAPLLVRAEGSVHRLAATATVLGLFEDWACSVAEVGIAPCDTLLLFTDGASEATDRRDESFGETRLIDSLLHHRHLPLPLLVQEMMREIWTFTGGRRQDDTTLVVARGTSRSGKSPLHAVRFPVTEARP